MNLLKHKGYTGTYVNHHSRGFVGCVIHIEKALVFEGESLETLGSNFEKEIDRYLFECVSTDEKPEKPFCKDVGSIYRNNKSGALYELSEVIKDVTNGNDGKNYIKYHGFMDAWTYGRSEDEFREKFTLIADPREADRRLLIGYVRSTMAAVKRVLSDPQDFEGMGRPNASAVCDLMIEKVNIEFEGLLTEEGGLL